MQKLAVSGMVRTCRGISVIVLALGLGPRAWAAEGVSITVADLLAGVRQRRSEIVSVQVDYEIENRWFDAARKAAEWDRKQRELAGAPADERTNPMPTDYTEHYVVVQRDEARAFTVLAPDGVATHRGASLDGVYRAIEPKRREAVVARVAPEDVISFPTINQLTGVNNVDIEVYLRENLRELDVARTEEVRGDVLVTLVRRQKVPVVGASASELRLTRIDEVTMNASKDFWLSQLLMRLEIQRAGKPQETWVSSRTTVDEFWESNGHFYPRRITAVEYNAVPPEGVLQAPGPARWEARSEDMVPASQKVTRVKSVALNAEIPDDAFDLPFPPGTRYRDEIRDGYFIVDSDGAIEELAQALGMPILPADKYTPEEADKILREYRKSHMSRERRDHRWLIGFTMFFACVVAGLLISRRLRRGRA